MATLAELYFHGYGTEANKEMALKYYKKAARKGVPRAQYKSGLMYLQAPFKDVAKGIEYLIKSNNKGYKHANYTQGMIYYSDEFGYYDLAKADKYLAQAYEDKHFAIPEFIEHIQVDKEITSQNFPSLAQQMSKQPLAVDGDDKLTWPVDNMKSSRF